MSNPSPTPTPRVPHSSQPHRDEWDPLQTETIPTPTTPNPRVPHSSQPHRDEWDPLPPTTETTPTPQVPHSSQPHRDEWDQTTTLPNLQSFLTQSQTLAAQLNAATTHPAASGDPLPRPTLHLLLATLKAHPPEAQPALYTWLLLRATCSAARACQLFDELRLRNGLASTFAAFNLHAEQGWRAAAQVRLLLQTDLTPLRQTLTDPLFWQSPDTHWLAGIDPTGEYIHQESFERLLPLLAFPPQTPATEQSTILSSLKQSAYNQKTFRQNLST